MQVIIKNRRAYLQNNQAIITDNSDYTIEFLFDAEWQNSGTKTAVILKSDGTEYEPRMLDVNNCITLPVIRNTPWIYIGVTAGNIRTTAPVKILVENSVLAISNSGHVPDPDPYIYAIITEKLDTISKQLDTSNTEYIDQAIDNKLSYFTSSLDDLEDFVNTVDNKIRKASSAQWEVEPTLVPHEGQIIVYTDLGKIKIGDGVSDVASLPFMGADDIEQIHVVLDTHIADTTKHLTTEDHHVLDNAVTAQVESEILNLLFIKE